MNKQAKIFLSVIIVLILGTIVTVFMRAGSPSGMMVKDNGEYDQFAQCLADSGASFYGAFWCPACREQKKMFGSSVRLLPYVECSTPAGNAQTPICIEKGVDRYPTWDFADGSRMNGILPLETLAEKTSCQLPQ